MVAVHSDWEPHAENLRGAGRPTCSIRTATPPTTPARSSAGSSRSTSATPNTPTPRRRRADGATAPAADTSTASVAPFGVENGGQAVRLDLPLLRRLRGLLDSPHVLRIESRHPHSRSAPEQPAQSRPRHPDRRAGRGHRRVGLGQELARVRHAVRRRSAPLRRDVLAVRAAVPRSHGPSRRGPHRRRAAGDRDRPDQSGAHVAQHGRHDDRAERPPEAAVRARLAPVLPQLLAPRAARHAGVDLRQPRRARARRRLPPHRDLPGEDPEELRRGRGARAARGTGLRAHPRRTQGRRRQDPRRRRRPLPLGRHRALAHRRRARARAARRRRPRRRPRREARGPTPICGGTAPTCTARRATSTTRRRTRARSRSTRRWVPATRAAGSAA